MAASAPTQPPLDGRNSPKPGDKGQIMFSTNPGGTKGK